ncbi:MAG: Fic family protein [Chloroflexi bacterium]|nr:Fic family protein [Chloroflexota bacterium]
MPLRPGVRERLNRVNIMRAVRGTTGIEGTQLSEDEVGQILESADPVLESARAREEKEARNAASVMDFVAQTLGAEPNQPLTEELIKDIHFRTTQGIDYPHNTPGHYREHGVSAGTYFAPQAASVPCLMQEFLAWLRSGPVREWPAAIRAVAAHFYLISIHPFGDGNGRTSRAVESFILYQAGINALGFYSLANFYYRMRPEYFEMLDQTRFVHDGDLTEFVRFSLNGLLEELEQVHAEAVQELTEIAFSDYARERLQRSGNLRSAVGERRLNLTLEATGAPIPLSALQEGTHHASLLYRDRSSRTISRDLNYLEGAGLIVIEGDSIKANLDIMRQFTADPFPYPRTPGSPGDARASTSGAHPATH